MDFKLSYIIANVFNLIIIFMVIRALLSWFPQTPWHKEPFKTLRVFTDTLVAPFEKVIPPIGMLNIAFMVACFAIGLIGGLLVMLLMRFGL